MKIHIFRNVAPSDVEIGDVVLWETNPVEVESITRTKDGYELTGHNRYKPGLRAITIRPQAEQLLRVLPNSAQGARLAGQMEAAIKDGGVDNHQWKVEMIEDLKPLRVRAGKAPTVTTGEKADAPVS